MEDLTNSMKQAEHGDFQNIQAELFDYDRTDEVGYLQKDFIKMIRKINVLITEDYRKQLIIKDTEYRALQSQIDPHFLYNTLSTVSWLARTGKTEQISQVTISLGNLMRASISQTSVIQLRDEVDMLQDYINIQRLRYEDRVVFEVDIHEEHLQYAVPKMVLQPIVENAIKYGAEEMLDVCHIRVYSYEEQDRVTVVIEDDGPGLDAKTLCSLRTMTYKPKGTGIGLKNIDDRLKMLFDETSGLRFESGPQVGMKVSFSIPKGGA